MVKGRAPAVRAAGSAPAAQDVFGYLVEQDSLSTAGYSLSRYSLERRVRCRVGGGAMGGAGEGGGGAGGGGEGGGAAAAWVVAAAAHPRQDSGAWDGGVLCAWEGADRVLFVDTG